MINAYTEISNYDGNDFQDFLNKICLVDIFLPVLKEYEEKVVAKMVIKYIVHCYSINSEKIIQGTDWGLNKKRIFEDCLFPPNTEKHNFFEETVHLKNEAVALSCKRWIEFQDNEIYSDLIMLKDLKFQMRVSSVTDIKNAAGEINYDQKMKNAKYVLELEAMIKETESRMIQNTTLKHQVKEINNSFKSKKNTLSVESMIN